MENILICKYCNKECKNLNSLRCHERLCKENPNRQTSNLGELTKKGHKGSNQFIKAKELGLPIPKGTNTGKEGFWKGKHLPDEIKKKISAKQKQNLLDGKVFGYKLNHSSKVSYPEKYFMEVFKDLPVKYNYRVDLYRLDFAIPEKMVYVEIDGEQHFVDKRIVEHDKERTEKLDALGWKCLRRVRWSEYQKLSQSEKEDYCKELINELQQL